MSDTLLEIRHLNIEFHDHDKPESVVNDFNLTLQQGEIVGIVGESGSGKSMTAMAIAGLLRRHDMKKSGEILFEGTELLHAKRSLLRQYGIPGANDFPQSGKAYRLAGRREPQAAQT